MTQSLRNKVRTAAKIVSAVSIALFFVFVGKAFIEYASFKSRFVNGQAAVKSGDYDRAIRDLEFVVHRDPNWSLARHLLGVAYIKRGEQLIGAVGPDHFYSQHKLLGARYGYGPLPASKPENVGDAKRAPDKTDAAASGSNN